MKESLEISEDTGSHHAQPWTASLKAIASFGSQSCQDQNSVHSAFCSITGSPDALLVDLACTATNGEYVADLIEYVNDRLLPRMEQVLGVQFEARNLQFAVSGMEDLVSPLEQPIQEASADNWPAHSFVDTSLTPASGLKASSDSTMADLSMA